MHIFSTYKLVLQPFILNYKHMQVGNAYRTIQWAAVEFFL